MDASEYRLGAALIQNGYPITFASKMLTDMLKAHYANIERECLSVCFGLKKFHTYLYSRHVTIQNDHKLLEMIQQKPIHAVSPHLQCMLFHMQKYDYTIQYKPCKEMVRSWSPKLLPLPQRIPPHTHSTKHPAQLSTAKLDATQGSI